MQTPVGSAPLPTPALNPPAPAQFAPPTFDLTDIDLMAFVWHIALAIGILLVGRWLARIARRGVH